MSTTTTTTTTQAVPRYSIARTLADYDLHHSTPEKPQAEGEAEQSASAAPETGNPPTWETEYRRVPPHRPVNTQIDVASRSITLNGIETFFVYNMFNGIRIVEVSLSPRQ
jgi:hypothetical protein